MEELRTFSFGKIKYVIRGKKQWKGYKYMYVATVAITVKHTVKVNVK